TCLFCVWKLSQLRHTIRQWEHQLKALEQELQQTLAQAPAMILAGPQQIKQGRRQLRQLQANLKIYYQWSQILVIVLQWVQSGLSTPTSKLRLREESLSRTHKKPQA
ncbi:MAG: hypothetical protein AB4042_16280, partial [Leptolyngbyaceae cyanobacterium]